VDDDVPAGDVPATVADDVPSLDVPATQQDNVPMMTTIWVLSAIARLL
jgi:hypothetical protein